MELHTNDVGGRLTPLVGAWSRFGWRHPGPLGFWLLAMPYRLAGNHPVGLLLGAAFVNSAAMVGSLLLAARRGGWRLAALVGLGHALLIHSLGIGFLINFWNPYLPTFSLVFLVLATWSVVEGDRYLLPAVVVMACIAWQSHISYVPLSVMLVTVAVLGAARGFNLRPIRELLGERRSLRARWAGRPSSGLTNRNGRWIAAATAGAVVVCMLPIVIEQLTRSPGNIRLIVRYLVGEREPTSWAFGAGAAAHLLSPAGWWADGLDQPELGGGLAGTAPVIALVPVVGVVGVVIYTTARFGAASSVRFLGVTALAMLAGLGMAMGTNDPFEYLFIWLRPLAMMLWIATLWGVITMASSIGSRTQWTWLSVSGPRPRFARWMRTLPRSFDLTVAAAIVVVSVTAAAGPAMLPDERMSGVVMALGSPTVEALEGIPRAHLVLSNTDGRCAFEQGTGLAAQLEAHGIETVLDPQWEWMFARDRVPGDEPTVELVCGPDTTHTVAARAPQVPVAVTGLLSPGEAAELTEYQEELRAAVRAQDRLDLLDAVDDQVSGGFRLIWSGLSFDRYSLNRFDQLMQRSRFSGAVFLRSR